MDGAFTYTGNEIKPEVKTLGNMGSNKTGWKITYSNNKNAGEASVVCTEDESNVYVIGRKELSFTINKADIPAAASFTSTNIKFGESTTATITGYKEEMGEIIWEVASDRCDGRASLSDPYKTTTQVKPTLAKDVVLKASIDGGTNYNKAEVYTSNTLTVTPIVLSSETTQANFNTLYYTGSEINPTGDELILSVNEIPLKCGEGYEIVSYTNESIKNIEAGTNKGVMTVRGIPGGGTTTDEYDIYFNIFPEDIGSSEITYQAPTTLTYNGEVQTPEINPITYEYPGSAYSAAKDSVLTEADYSVSSYSNNTNAGKGTTDKSPYITILGQGNYTGSKRLYFTILPADIKLAYEKTPVKGEPYNGEQQKPEPALYFMTKNNRELLLARDVDYHLTWYDNMGPTEGASVDADGLNNFTGSLTLYFDIPKRPVHVVPDPGQKKYYGQKDPDTFSYQLTNYLPGHLPVPGGKLGREAGETTGLYPYTINDLVLNIFWDQQEYELSLDSGSFQIANYEADGVAATVEGVLNPETGWYWKDRVKIKAPAGYTISAANQIDGTWLSEITYGDGDYSVYGITYYLRRDENSGDQYAGAISQAKILSGFKQDITAPSGNIVVNENVWTKLLNTITFGYFFPNTLDVKLVATDYTSGIGYMGYYVDDSGSGSAMTRDQLESFDGWTELAGESSARSFSISSEKSVIYGKLVDKAGNVSYISTDGLVIDEEKPVITVSYNKMGEWAGSEDGPAITGTVTERKSEIGDRKLTWTHGQTGAVQTITLKDDSTFRITSLPDGAYDVIVEAEDMAGNRAEPQTVQVKIDNTAPQIQAVQVSPSSDWQNQTVTVTVNAQDSLSGLSAWHYSLDGGASWTQGGSFPADATAMQQCKLEFPLNCRYEDQVLIRVADAAGNTAQTEPGQIQVRVDLIAPDIPACTIDNFGQTTAGDTVWYRNGAPQIHLTVPSWTETEAPVHTMYRIYKEGSSPSSIWNEGTSPLIGGEGIWVLEYYARDEAKNRTGETGTKKIRWDNTPPVIRGGSAAEAGGLLNWIMHKDEVLVTLDVEDAGSGLGALSYSLNGGAPVSVNPEKKTFYLPVGTTGTIQVTAVDKAKNEITQTLACDGKTMWNLENTPPVIGNFIPDKNASEKGLYSEAVRLAVTVSDADSGLKRVEWADSRGGGAVYDDISRDGLVHTFSLGDGKDQPAMSITEDGVTDMTLTVTDNAGNQTVKTERYVLDMEAPKQLRISLTAPGGYTGGSWTKQPVTLEFAASDGGSGIVELDYTIDGGLTWNNTRFEEGQADGLLTRELSDGIYDPALIRLRAVDEAGKTAEISLKDSITGMGMIKQDCAAPKQAEYKLYASGQMVKTEDCVWYGGTTAPRFELTMEASDTARQSEHRIYYVLYQKGTAQPPIGGSGWLVSDPTAGIPTVSKSLTGEGSYVLAWYTGDEAGNMTGQEKPKEELICWDNTAPAEAAFTFSTVHDGSLSQLGNYLTFGNYFKEAVRVTVRTGDGASGIGADGVEYTLDLKEWKTADCTKANESYRFDIPVGSSGTLYVRVTDRAGNRTARKLVQGEEASGAWMVESTVPELTEITIKEGAEDVHEDGSGNLWYNHDLKLISALRDYDSGLQKAEYRIDGVLENTYGDLWSSARTPEYIWEETLTKQGEVKVRLDVWDMAANTDYREKTLLLDKTEPSAVRMTVTEPAGPLTGYTNQNIKVRVSAEDAAYQDGDLTKTKLTGVRTSTIRGFAWSPDGGSTWSREQLWDVGDPGKNTFTIERDGLYGSETDTVKNGKILLRVWDWAGNCHETSASGSELLAVKRDTQAPPEAELKIISSGLTPADEDGWYTGPMAPAISLTVAAAGDCESANHVYWSLKPQNETAGEESTWGRDGTPTITDEGIWLLKWYTRDEAGNRTATRERTIRWDNTVPAYKTPAMTCTKVNDSPLASVGNFLTFGNFFKEAVKITIHGSDTRMQGTLEGASGINTLFYQLTNGGETEKHEIPVEQPYGGDYSFILPLGTDGIINVFAEDLAGNASPVLRLTGNGTDNSWKLEDTAPVIGEFQVDKTASDNGYYNDPITITVKVSDPDSGLKDITYDITNPDGTTETVTENEGLSDGKVTERTFTVPISRDGQTGIRLKVTDNADNSSASSGIWLLDTRNPDAARMKIDLAAPAGYQVNQWTNQTVHLVLTAKDDRSGIMKAAYSLNGGADWKETAYTGPQAEVILEADLEDGIYETEKILFKVWNRSDRNTTVSLADNPAAGAGLVKQDRLSPESAAFAMDSYGVRAGSGNTEWFSGVKPVVTLSLRNADQTREAVQRIYYAWHKEGEAAPAIGDSAWKKADIPAAGPVEVKPEIPGDGAYILTWYTEDEAYNSTDKSALKTQTIRWDQTLPVYDAEPFTFTRADGGPLEKLGTFLGFGNYFKEKVKVTAHVTDEHSGITETGVEYSWDQKTWKTADCETENRTYSFVLPMDMSGRLYVRTTDLAGNAAGLAVLGKEGSDYWHLEGIQPTITEILSETGAGGTRPGQGGSDEVWYNTDLKLSARIEDNDSGLKEVVYWIDKGKADEEDQTYRSSKEGDSEILWKDRKTTVFDWAETLTKQGEVTVRLDVADMADNGSWKERTFLVDQTEPSAVTMTVTNLPEDYSGGFLSQDFIIRVDAEDAAYEDGDLSKTRLSGVRTSGIRGFAWSLDGGSTWSGEQSWNPDDLSRNTFTIDRDGLYDSETETVKNGRILLKVYDWAGNCHDTQAKGSELLTVKRDTLPSPEAELAVTSSGTTPAEESGWYTGEQAPVIRLRVIKAGPYEAENRVYWSLTEQGADPADEKDWTCGGTPDGLTAEETAGWNYANPVITGEGIWVLKWYAMDEAGNRTGTRERTIRWDNTPPVYDNPAMTYTTTGDTTLEKLGNFLTFGNFFKETVKVTIHVTDTHKQGSLEGASGLAPLIRMIQTDGGMTGGEIPVKQSPYGGHFSFNLPVGTRGTIELLALDQAGNKADILKLDGEQGSNYWRVEQTSPNMGELEILADPNLAGWYRTDVPVTVTVTDPGSGLKQVTGWLEYTDGTISTIDGSISTRDGAYTEDDVKQAVTASNYLKGLEENIDSYTWEDTLTIEGEGMILHIQAIDHGENKYELTEIFHIDKTIPEITDIEGFPEALTETSPTVTFVVKDENSGIDSRTIRFVKDGEAQALPVSVEPIEGTRDYRCSVQLRGNGTYRINGSDAAGNAALEIVRAVNVIDESGVDGPEVTITPPTGDGDNSWYISTPSIAVKEPSQKGVIKVNTYYTLGKEDYEIGRPAAGTPSNAERAIQFKEDDPSTWPQITDQGIWYLHVWTMNETGTYGAWDFNGVMRFENTLPRNLVMEGVPEKWTNEDVTLKAKADPSYTELVSWSYTADGGETWSQWTDWGEENAFTLAKDLKDQSKVKFRVKSLAGNVTESALENIRRDTVRPELKPVSPKNGAVNVTPGEELVLEASETVETENAEGTLQIFKESDGSLAAEIQPYDEGVSCFDEEIRIRLPGNLEEGTKYFVEVKDGFVRDLAGNDSLPAGGAYRWSFTTAGESGSRKGLISGYLVDVVQGRYGNETVIRVEPQEEDQDGYDHVLYTTPAYLDQDGTRYTLLHILPKYYQADAAGVLTADDDRVTVAEADLGAFEVWIPEELSEAVLFLRPSEQSGESAERDNTLRIVLGAVDTSAEGYLNPEINPTEVSNSVDLRYLEGQPVRLRLRTEERPGVSDETMRYLTGFLPDDVQTEPLEVGLTKEVGNGAGTKTEEVRNLLSPIHVSMDLPEALMGYRYYKVLRNHEGKLSLMKAAVMEGRISFKTDGFSEYAILCSNSEVFDEIRTEEPEMIVTDIIEDHVPGRNTPEWMSSVSMWNGGPGHEWFLWLIPAILLLLIWCIWEERRRRKIIEERRKRRRMLRNPGKPEEPGKPEKPGKPEEPEKPNKPHKTNRTEKPKSRRR